MDSRAGVWFSLGEDGSNADVDDRLAALPYGKYMLKSSEATPTRATSS